MFVLSGQITILVYNVNSLVGNLILNNVHHLKVRENFEGYEMAHATTKVWYIKGRTTPKDDLQRHKKWIRVHLFFTEFVITGSSTSLVA